MHNVQNYNSFQKQYKFYQEKRKIVIDYFTQQGYKVVIPDNAVAKSKGISFKATKDGVQTCYSLKSDTRISGTGNLYVEQYHIRKDSTGRNCRQQGWYQTLDVDKLLYFDVNKMTMLIINWAELKSFIKANINDPNVITISNDINSKDEGTITVNIKLSLSTIKNNGIPVKEISISQNSAESNR